MNSRTQQRKYSETASSLHRVAICSLFVAFLCTFSFPQGHCEPGSGNKPFKASPQYSAPAISLDSLDGDPATTSSSQFSQRWGQWGPSKDIDDEEDSPRSPSPNIVPLSLDGKKQKTKEATKDTRGATKWTQEPEMEVVDPQTTIGEDSEDDMSSIRQKALHYGKMVLEYLASIPKHDSDQTGDNDIGTGRSGRTLAFLDGNPDPVAHETNANVPAAHKRRGVIDWLGRLIGVQGKTLGEFLREYQVHVLYDLVFTFFKWIFFLYAGLLIP